MTICIYRFLKKKSFYSNKVFKENMDIKNLKLLNKKQTKIILGKIKDQWDATINLDDYAVFVNNKNKVYIVKRDCFEIDVERLRINSLGIYFCETEKGIRLSIEGSQIVGPKAKENIINIGGKQIQSWIKGEDIYVQGNYKGFVIIKSGKDYLGTGNFKEGKVLNFVPKTRRLNI